MNTFVARRFAVAALVLTLPLTSLACGSDDDDAATTTTEQADAPGDGASDDVSADDPTDASADDPADDAGTDDAGSDGTGAEGEGECVEDPDTLSGSATVLFSADVTTGQTEADITPELTMTVGADGTAEPATLTVPVDTMFGIGGAEDAGLTAFVVGCASGQTAPAGVTVGFLITAPGTYVVVDELADVEVGTIVVE